MAEGTVRDRSVRPDLPGMGPWRSTPAPAGFEPFPDAAVSGSVAERFVAVALANPDRVALRSPAGQWTFAELLADARSRAGGIRAALAEGPPVPVAVLADHDGPLVVALLAILLADQIVVILDPQAPDDQSIHLLDECAAPLLIHDDAHATQAARLAGAGRAQPATAAFGSLEGPPVEAPGSVADDVVMLAFTSGTSGASKAGAITNGVLLNVIRGATNALGIGPDDRLPMLFPISLAVAAYPLLLPLLNGGTLATLDLRAQGLAPLAPFLRDERITVAYIAPTIVRFLAGSLDGHDFPDLRLLALGGEVVDADVVRLTRDLLGPERIANGFGATETGVITLYVLEPDEVPEGVVPAGYPVPGIELRILDEHGRPVPNGTSGEVTIASPHLFHGYWGHDELNAQVLLDDPDQRPGWHCYRTGDLGVLDAAGALTVLGRLDTKVKVRGRFVVLGDVEAEVQALDGVADAVVVATATGGVTELTAVLAPTPGPKIDAQAYRADLLCSSEAYRVPERWLVLDELPLLPNGKVDRRAITDLVEARQTSHASVAARDVATAPTRPAAPSLTSTEAVVSDLWRTMLPVGPVGLDDDFFHLGGHSLLAAQMLVAAEERFGIAIPMSTMVDARTVRQVSRVIDRLRAGSEANPTTVARVQEGHPADRPRLWFVHDLPGSAYRVRHLAAALGDDQPVWSFESPLLRGEPNTYEDLNAFVDRYVRDLLVAQPEGPYWLSGYCFGGICAYQMARQLMAEGHEVAFMGMVDVGPSYRGPNWKGRHSPPWPYFGVPYPPPPGSSAVAVARHYATMAATSPKGFIRHLTLRTGLARHIDTRRFASDLRNHGRVRPRWRLWYAWEEHWKLATRAWDRASAFDGRVHLLWADQTSSLDETLGWGGLVEDLRITRFPGFHDDLLEEHGVEGLANALRSVIDAELDGRSIGTSGGTAR